MDDREKLEFVTNELIAIYEDYESLVDQLTITKNFLQMLIEFSTGETPHYNFNSKRIMRLVEPEEAS